MKKLNLLLLSIIITVFSVCSVTAFAIDNKSPWATESINKANSYGIIPDNLYLGNYTAPIKRIDIATLISNAYKNITGYEYVTHSTPFTDTDSVYASIVYELGIMSGKGDNLFAPDDFTTREEMAKIILSFKSVITNEELVLPQFYENVFTDFDYISDWAKPYVVKANSEKILNGYENGRFGARDTVTHEAAIAIVTRAVSFNEKSIPHIISPYGDTVLSNMQGLDISVSADGECNIYAIKHSSTPSLNHIGVSDANGYMNIPGDILDANSLYYIFAECDGVFSDAVRVFTGDINLHLDVPSHTSAGNLTIKWNRLPNITSYTVKITEKRNSYYENDIAPNTIVYELTDEDLLNFFAGPDKKYTIELTAGNYYAAQEVFVSDIYNDDAKDISASYPTTKEEADALMVSVTVPVWRLQNGVKVSSTATLKVHNKIAEKVKLVFEDIYNGPEQFPIKDVGGYSWRGGRSEHNGGTAIDINYDENYCLYKNGTTVGSHWKPYEDPFSITPYGDVIKAFEKYGFTWGGDAWSNPKDYMHFSYLGT